MFSICPCNHCLGHIQFDDMDEGNEGICPHCEGLTVLQAVPETGLHLHSTFFEQSPPSHPQANL